MNSSIKKQKLLLGALASIFLGAAEIVWAADSPSAAADPVAFIDDAYMSQHASRPAEGDQRALVGFSLAKAGDCPFAREAQEWLNRFFENPDVELLLCKTGKPIFSQDAKQLATNDERRRGSTDCFCEFTGKANEVLKYYGLRQASHNAFIFLMGNYVIKIAKVDWYPPVAAGLPVERYPWQLLSREFYHIKIKKLIKRGALKHIRALHSFLWHIPGKPDDFDDRNYVVLEEQVKHAAGFEPTLMEEVKEIGSHKVTLIREQISPACEAFWKDLPTSSDASMRELAQELAWLMEHAPYAMWDLEKLKFNVVIEDAVACKAVVIDTEVPGLGCNPNHDAMGQELARNFLGH